MAKVELTAPQENWLKMFVEFSEHRISQEMDKYETLWERVEYFLDDDIDVIYEVYDSILVPLWKAEYIDLKANTDGELPEVEVLEITDKARKWYEKKYLTLSEKVEKMFSEVDAKMVIKGLLELLKK